MVPDGGATWKHLAYQDSHLGTTSCHPELFTDSYACSVLASVTNVMLHAGVFQVMQMMIQLSVRLDLRCLPRTCCCSNSLGENLQNHLKPIPESQAASAPLFQTPHVPVIGSNMQQLSDQITATSVHKCTALLHSCRVFRYCM